MVPGASQQRWIWLAAGLLGGLCISYFWPHESVRAATNDRAAKFGLCTCSVQQGVAGVAPELEGVFVLDYLTGRLQGAVLNPKSGKFTYAYSRNVAADFQVNPNVEAIYAMVAGSNQLPSIGRVPAATGVLYVAEMNTGKVGAYMFPYAESRVPVSLELTPLDTFAFRKAN